MNDVRCGGCYLVGTANAIDSSLCEMLRDVVQLSQSGCASDFSRVSAGQQRDEPCHERPRVLADFTQKEPKAFDDEAKGND